MNNRGRRNLTTFWRQSLDGVVRKFARITRFLRGLPKRYAVYLVASVLCGLIIAGFHLVPKLTDWRSMPNSPVAAQAVTSTPKPKNYPRQDNQLFAAEPSWAQDFSDSSSEQLDSRYWNVLVGPAQNSNNEQQYYSDKYDNLRIEGGALRLIATHQAEPNGYNYGSARIETEGKQAFLYGRIDITAKLPAGAGTWPAVWMLPANTKYEQLSPDSDTLRYKNGGEVDIIEAVGSQPDVIYGIAHTLSDLDRHPDGTGSYSAVSVLGSSTNFNKYTLLWTPTTMTFEVNDREYYTYTRQKGANYTTWPFDQPFYIIANLAMGGSWGGIDTARYPGNGINNNALPTSLDIRSIYYYPYVAK